MNSFALVLLFHAAFVEGAPVDSGNGFWVARWCDDPGTACLNLSEIILHVSLYLSTSYTVSSANMIMSNVCLMFVAPPMGVIAQESRLPLRSHFGDSWAFAWGKGRAAIVQRPTSSAAMGALDVFIDADPAFPSHQRLVKAVMLLGQRFVHATG
jgi:hypothetical protein